MLQAQAKAHVSKANLLFDDFAEVLKGRQRIANAEQNSLDAIILKKLAEETLHDGKDGNDVLEDEEDYHDSRFTKVIL